MVYVSMVCMVESVRIDVSRRRCGTNIRCCTYRCSAIPIISFHRVIIFNDFGRELYVLPRDMRIHLTIRVTTCNAIYHLYVQLHLCLNTLVLLSIDTCMYMYIYSPKPSTVFEFSFYIYIRSHSIQNGAQVR